MKAKTLCKISKEVEIKDFLELASSLVYAPSFICGKCGRASNQETFLCEPNQIIPPSQELEQLSIEEKLPLFNKKADKEKKDKHKEEKKEKHKEKDKHKEKKEKKDKKDKKSEEEE